ncbi:hypothetical protein [Halomonas denitrificans]|nr:hypothetical protein [Halomonas denitrificans]
MMRIDGRNNLLSVILLAGIGLAAVIGALNFLLLGRADADRIEPAGAAATVDGEARSPTLEIGELDRYAVITERPVFFEDRQLPEIDTGEAADEDAETEVAVVEEVPDLEARVAGIIITPDLRLAMIADPRGQETVVLREGMALEGDLSAWKLEEISPRSVRFATDSGRSADLELIVETDALSSGAPTRPPPNARQAAAEPTTDAETGAEPVDNEAQAAARARAEEIRRRVAERRAQLRAEAERRAREQRDNDGR